MKLNYDYKSLSQIILIVNDLFYVEIRINKTNTILINIDDIALFSINLKTIKACEIKLFDHYNIT